VRGAGRSCRRTPFKVCKSFAIAAASSDRCHAAEQLPAFERAVQTAIPTCRQRQSHPDKVKGEQPLPTGLVKRKGCVRLAARPETDQRAAVRFPGWFGH